jgi:acyl carrier protein
MQSEHLTSIRATKCTAHAFALFLQVAAVVSEVLGHTPAPSQPLLSAGLDSLGAVELRSALEGRLSLQLPATLVFDYPTLSALTDYLTAQARVPDDCHRLCVAAFSAITHCVKKVQFLVDCNVSA